MADAFLGLGSNLGDRAGYLRSATSRLAALPGTALVAASGIYETPPWGLTEQPAFLNQVLRIETTLEPLPLLRAALAVESELGRVRDVRWGPRAIDIDILSYDDLRSDDPDLVLPHPRLFERAFVLVPLHEIAPDLVIDGRAVADALATLDRTGIVRHPE
jgi:2-amino-4-hydroxy-6-hydroxymethyldihydropteridine diphosphokinase